MDHVAPSVLWCAISASEGLAFAETTAEPGVVLNAAWLGRGDLDSLADIPQEFSKSDSAEQD